MTETELDAFRNDLKASLRRAKTYQRNMSGTPHEVRLALCVEALDRCVRDLTFLLIAAGGVTGLYSGAAVERDQSHGQRRSGGLSG